MVEERSEPGFEWADGLFEICARKHLTSLVVMALDVDQGLYIVGSATAERDDALEDPHPYDSFTLALNAFNTWHLRGSQLPYWTQGG